MRSPLATLALALATLVVGALAVWSFQRGGLDEIFGAPHTPPGELLYPGFQPDAVVRMEISIDGNEATLVRADGGWRMLDPISDRADSRAASSILQFTQGLRVEDGGIVDDTDRTATGMEDGSVRVRLLDGQENRLADYRLGRRTPWIALVKVDSSADDPELVPTVFVETRDRGRRNHVYICAGDISPLFRENLRFLRDHRPFFFNPAALQSIQLRTPEGEMSLGRETPASPWRIQKPLELGTDVAAVRTLLERLFDLQAIEITNGAPAPTTPEPGAARTLRIAMAAFQADGTPAEETILDAQLPDDAEARYATATVSNRPGVTFRIPAKPEPDFVSFADLPLSVNSLRDPTLTNLRIGSLASIAIRPSTGREIHISHDPGRPWMASIVGENAATYPANERRLFELLNAVTNARVISFETDAAVDLSPWGLDRPILSLAFLGRDHQLLELDFGIDPQGRTYVNRRGTSTVSRLDDGFLTAISVRPYEWRLARVWSLSRVDLTKLVRLRTGAPPELLEYDFIHETWQATRGEQDATPELIQTRANFLLTSLEGIECERWLADDDAAALAALAKPDLRISVFENEIDEIGDPIGEIRRDIGFAVAPDHPGFFYGMHLGEPHPFLIAEDVVRNLALPVFDADE